MTTFNDVEAQRRGVTYLPIVIITIGGAGSNMDGYPADLANALIDAGFPGIHQPVGYPAAAVPMEPSVDAGTAAGLRLFRQVWADHDVVFIVYSEGSLVYKAMYDAMTPEERGRILAAATFGFPAREEGHTIPVPGAIDPGGHGIVSPNMINTPVWQWDFACGKAMVGSPGQDLYTTLGYDGNADSVADEEAVWEIVDHGTIQSVQDLIKQVIALITNPLQHGIGALYAVMDAGLFFVLEGLTGHTSYQTVQPIKGDPRDCWRVAFDYLFSVGVAYAQRAA